MERDGWEVRSADEIDPGYSCLKTGCLGLIFLPLALLGKKPKQTRVTFQREEESDKPLLDKAKGNRPSSMVFPDAKGD